MATEIHKGDVGTVFVVTILKSDGDVLDISSATKKQLTFDKPRNGKLTKSTTVEFVTDGSDGKVKYTTEDNDLDEAGAWTLQAYIETPIGKWYSNITNFEVYPNI